MKIPPRILIYFSVTLLKMYQGFIRKSFWCSYESSLAFSGYLKDFCGIFTDFFFNLLDILLGFWRISLLIFSENLIGLIPTILQQFFRISSRVLLEWFLEDSQLVLPEKIQRVFWKNPRGISRKILEKPDNLKIISERVPEDKS